MNRILYRFSLPYPNSKPFTMTFESDDDMFEYANGLTDGPEMAVVERWNNDWFAWDLSKQLWVYNPNADRSPCQHFVNPEIRA